jgi:hypothetical protein
MTLALILLTRRYTTDMMVVLRCAISLVGESLRSVSYNELQRNLDAVSHAMRMITSSAADTVIAIGTRCTPPSFAACSRRWRAGCSGVGGYLKLLICRELCEHQSSAASDLARHTSHLTHHSSHIPVPTALLQVPETCVRACSECNYSMRHFVIVVAPL